MKKGSAVDFFSIHGVPRLLSNIPRPHHEWDSSPLFDLTPLLVIRLVTLVLTSATATLGTDIPTLASLNK